LVGLKFDGHKDRWDLVPWRTLRLAVRLRSGRLREKPVARSALPTPVRLDLVPGAPLRSVAMVLGYGAQKYAPGNWLHVEGGRWRYFAAAVRHMVAWWLGERFDPESGLHHLAHAICCLMFAMGQEVQQEP